MASVDSRGTRQTDARTAAIEVKVKKLDAELQGYKDKMAKMKAGPGKVRRVPPNLLSAVAEDIPRWMRSVDRRG
jgi:hypothetical protein